jgi:hypothetical protein
MHKVIQRCQKSTIDQPLRTAFAKCSPHRIFFKKNRKNRLCRRPLPGALGTYFFQKKVKTPLFADGPALRPSAKKISKTVNLTRR